MTATLTVLDQLAAAARLLRAGHRSEAEAAYRELLVLSPGQIEALRGLCYICMEADRSGEALQFAERAVACAPADARLQLLLGRVYKARGEPARALLAYEDAVRLQPTLAEAWVSLGIALRGQDPQRALACCEQAQQHSPDDPLGWINAANVLLDLGRAGDAEAALRRAAAVAPRSADAQLHLAKLLGTRGRPAEAAQCLRLALAANPLCAEAALLLAQWERANGRLSECIELLQAAVAASPRDTPALLQLGDAQTDLQRYADAVATYRRCAELDPASTEPLVRLSILYRMCGDIGLALQAADQVVALGPQGAAGHLLRADALTLAGESEEAGAIYTRELPRHNTPDFFANYLLISNYDSSVGPRELLARHREFGARFCELPRMRHDPAADPDRRLRVGYVSADLRRHSVAYFIEPVLARHDRRAVEVVCYFTHPVADDVTERLKHHADRWIDGAQLSDDELAARIRADGIDILVDVGGHTGGSRLRVFARKPAPVQVSWLAYPTTTGVPAIDYRLTDWEVDPPGAEAWNVERPVRLPHSYYCYRPGADCPPVGDLPAAQHGRFTFGSFNDLSKVTAVTAQLWAGVVTAVPGSRLLLKSGSLGDARVRKRIAARFERLGVARERLELRGWEVQPKGHLSLYGRVDVALDTYPYNGGTTTCEALWMGVPVVTLAGETHASRMGASLLKAAGLERLVAGTPEDYVQIAAMLARQRDELAALRRGMRLRLQAAPLMDEAGFTAALEAAYRGMWKEWCEQARA